MKKVYLVKTENLHTLLLEALTKSDAAGGYEIDEIGSDDPALEHLRKLVDNGGCGPRQRFVEGTCNFCGEWESDSIHKPDCPWVAAKLFLERLNIATSGRARSGLPRW